MTTVSTGSHNIAGRLRKNSFNERNSTELSLIHRSASIKGKTLSDCLLLEDTGVWAACDQRARIQSGTYRFESASRFYDLQPALDSAQL